MRYAQPDGLFIVSSAWEGERQSGERLEDERDGARLRWPVG